MKNMKKQKNILIGLLILMPCILFAEVPTNVSYQGRLTDKNNIPITGPVSLTFSIWDDPTGGTSLWGPITYNPVSVVRGVFNVRLGTGIAALPFDKPYYLKISLNGSDLEPRRPLLTTGYAFRAQTANSVTNRSVTSNSIVPQNITSSNIKNNTIRYLDLASDTNSLNKVSGGLMSASNNSIRVGRSTNTPYNSLLVNGNIRVSASNGLEFTSDRKGRKIDLGFNATKAKWIGIDDNWWLAQSDDAGFRWYQSSTKDWGSIIMELANTGLLVKPATTWSSGDVATINLGNTSTSIKNSYGGGFTIDSDNPTVIMNNGKTNTVFQSVGTSGITNSIYNKGWRTGDYADYVILPLFSGGWVPVTGLVGSKQTFGSTILYPDQFRPDGKLDIDYFVLGHMNANCGGADNISFSLYNFTSSATIGSDLFNNSCAGDKWQHTGWQQLNLTPGTGYRIDAVVWQSINGDNSYVANAYLLVRPRR